MSNPKQEVAPPPFRIFATTQWSVVLAAGEDDSILAEHALEALCITYWYPIYVYVRRKGHGPDDAQDLTQEFFLQLIAKKRLRLADGNKGRFRSFLLALLDSFLARQWSREHRQKRGGLLHFISFDLQTPEERYRLEPPDSDSPGKNFDRQWAMTVLRQAMDTLQRECEAAGKGALFGELKVMLSGEDENAAYSTIAPRLGMTQGAVRVAVHRLRQRYGEILRAEVAQTVESADDVDEEMRYLLSALVE